MKKALIFAVILTSFVLELSASDDLYITCNKSYYVVGEQVVFDVNRFQAEPSQDEESESVIFMDLVAPSGEIVQSKSMIKTEEGRYFFSLSDSLKTGVYRLIGNSEGANQSIKRIHVFALELEEQVERAADKIEHKIEGGVLVQNQSNRVVVRVTDNKGAGVLTKGTLVNAVDSLVQYLDTDPNGLVAFEFNSSDSLYKVRFGNKTLELNPLGQTVYTKILENKDTYTVQVLNPTLAVDTLNVSVNGMTYDQIVLSSDKDSLMLEIPKAKLAVGIQGLTLESDKMLKRNYVLLNRPLGFSKAFRFDALNVASNELVEISLEDSADLIDYLTVSVIDKEQTSATNFYEEYYFDQAGLDLLLVGERDFEAYVTFFGATIEKKENNDRLSASQKPGVLAYKTDYPYDQVSMLDLTTMRVLDLRCENLHGIDDFEKAMSGKSQVFPYHFTTYLQPIDLADFTESVDYKYAPLNSTISFGEKEVALVKSYDMQRNIALSFKGSTQEKNRLPAPDYVYEMENFDVPNTMIDMINYIVKFVSIVKNSDNELEFSMYRYMSTYKYRGVPLLFLNDVPVYDAQTILNLNPKNFDRVEVRNSYKANGHLGNFSLNGSVSFFLKEDVDNPLDEAYKKLPVLESCVNFNKKSTDNEHAPDFRHQLYWNPKVMKTKDSFWIDLKSSDLSATYDIQVTAFLKDGTVVEDRSQLVVK